MRWIDAAEQARLKSLLFTPRRHAATLAPGRHQTHIRGTSRDFSQHRSYVPGDDPRAIDWRVTARMDRTYIREYRAEDRACLAIILDASRSMLYSSNGRPPKLDIARKCAAGLAWLAVTRHDETGLFISGADAAGVSARGGAAQLEEIDKALTALSPGDESDLGAALRAVGHRAPRRAAIVVISDLLGNTQSVLSALRALGAGRELLLLRVLDPDEAQFPFEGRLTLEGLEGGRIAVEPGVLVEEYRKAFAAQRETYRGVLRRDGCAYAEVLTDAPWTQSVARLLRA